ncbi:MAG: cytochrome c family protein [Reyranellaceae bacterium]
MKGMVSVALAAAALGLSFHAASAQDWAGGDAEKGKKVFNKCMTCHRIGEDAKNMVGPVLTGVVGRKAGTAPGFQYSTLNHNAGENGLVWSEQMIFEYLVNPNNFLKKFLTEKGKADLAVGSTKMVFNLPSVEERKDVIAFLKTFSK